MIGRTHMLIAAGAIAVLAGGIGIGAALAGGGSAKPAAPTIAAATVTSSSAPADFTLDGQLTLKLGAFQWNRTADGSTTCAGWQGYSDIAVGAPVVIADQNGTTIATGQLDQSSAAIGDDGRATTCTFTFAVQQVPDRPFYGVTVSHRGTITYSAAQAKSGQVALSLG